MHHVCRIPKVAALGVATLPAVSGLQKARQQRGGQPSRVLVQDPSILVHPASLHGGLVPPRSRHEFCHLAFGKFDSNTTSVRIVPSFLRFCLNIVPIVTMAGQQRSLLQIVSIESSIFICRVVRRQ
jgi:hypothetical protein